MSGNGQFAEFRADDIKYVMQLLLAGRSCALIGVGGIGKTRLMRNLLSSVMHRYYLKERWQQFIFVPLNSHELTSPSALDYYRLMMLHLGKNVRQGEAQVYDPFSIVQREAARQALFDRVDAVLAGDDRRMLVFLFDAFDVAFQEVEPHFFRVLLALRDRVPGRICYVATGSNIPRLVCDEGSRKIVLEAFTELFDGNVRGLKPVERDAQMLLESEMLRSEYDLSPRIQRLLLEITGGHAGLLRSSFAALATGSLMIGKYESADHLVEQLLHSLLVSSHCEQIWNSLSEIEQACLKQMQHGMLLRSILGQAYGQQAHDALSMLVHKGILIEVQRDRSYCCFSVLFATYIARRFASFTPGLRIDFVRKQVWVDGVLLPERLTRKEFQLLAFLAEHHDKTCSRGETTRAVYGDDYIARQDDARLDALVERTRKHIGDNPREPRFLLTIRGEGHKLNEYQL